MSFMPSAFPHASRSRRPSPYNRRLWSLLVALCVVGAMMRHLRQPETVDQLGRVFGLPTESTSEKSQESFEDLDESPQTFDSAQIDRGASLSDAEPRPLVPTSPLAPTNDDAWNLVVDDALFLQQELTIITLPPLNCTFNSELLTSSHVYQGSSANFS